MWTPADELLTLIYDTHAAVQNHSRSFDADAHHALARRAAAESTVLLKNEDNLLPLAAGTKVAVIGDFAEAPRYRGAGSSAVNSIKVDSLLGCWAESGLEQVGFAAGFDRRGKPDAAKQAEAVALAQKADVVLLCMGLDEIKESEGLDRSDMCVASNQIELLRALQKVNPNIVVVLSAGASVGDLLGEPLQGAGLRRFGWQCRGHAGRADRQGQPQRQAGRELGQGVFGYPRPGQLCRRRPHRAVPRGAVRAIATTRRPGSLPLIRLGLA